MTGGHPAVLAIVCDLVWGDDHAGCNAQEILEDLHAQPGELVARLVERLLERKGDPLLTRAVWAAAIPRIAAPDLLKHLLGDAAGSVDDLARVTSALERLTFVEQPWGRQGSLQLHPLIRRALADRMARIDRATFDELQSTTASYYRGLPLRAGGRGQAAACGPQVASNSWAQACSQGHRSEKCRPSHRADRASRRGTAMSWARMAASTSQAELAAKDPDGR